MSNKKLFLILLISLLAFNLFLVFSQTKIDVPAGADDLNLDEQTATIRSIENVMPAVVNISVYKTEAITVIDPIRGTRDKEEKEVKVGSGSGFLVSSDGLILTNKHVVSVGGSDVQYRIILSDGKKYYASLVDTDPINDLAVLKIYDNGLPFVELAEDDSLVVGSTVLAIGNALGRYQNTVTKGIVSGLDRSFTAAGFGGTEEYLSNVIQTDAEINPGNSGGPLVDLDGKVVGVNVAIDRTGNSIGFAIPISDARRVVESVKEKGMIIRPKLGIRYIELDEEIAEEYDLPLDAGAWVQSGGDEDAVLPDSPAKEAGIKEGDIIFEVDGVKLDPDNTLRSVINEYDPGDKIGFKVRRGEETIVIVAELSRF
jgi:S1-C subfamily serine protease